MESDMKRPRRAANTVRGQKEGKPVTTTHPSTVYTDQEWLVRSDRDPEHLYTIGIDPATLLFTCTCPDHQYRQRDCKHIRVVQAEQGIRRTMRRVEPSEATRVLT